MDMCQLITVAEKKAMGGEGRGAKCNKMLD